MPYVDGFVLPVPKKNLSAYLRMSRKAGRVWREHGALEYRECIGDDLDVKGVVPFGRLVRLKRGETVVFSWIVYKSRARPRPGERQGHEGPPPSRDDEPEGHALRHQAHDLRRLQGRGRPVARIIRGPRESASE